MRFDEKDPPRTYEVGFGETIEIRDCGSLELEPNEQVTFKTESGGEYDVARKDWGFYATPSLNARLREFGLRAVLVKNRIDRYFVLLVEEGKDREFDRYLSIEDLRIVTWLHDDESLERLERAAEEK